MSAHKDRLHAAAELLGMHPDDLLSKLDPPMPDTGTTPDRLQVSLRRSAAFVGGPEGGGITHEQWEDNAYQLAASFRDLDAHLSAGGTPPEAWREGPDAPELDAGNLITTREFTYGWDLTCDVCRKTIPEGSEALVTETRDEQYVSARHIECESTV